MNPQFKTWLNGALSAFCDGFVDGIPIGSSAGGAAAFYDGTAKADLQLHHLVIEAAHLMAVPMGSGMADFRAWKKVNPMPTLFQNPSKSCAPSSSSPTPSSSASPAPAPAVPPSPAS